jgi:hypothetical protein
MIVQNLTRLIACLALAALASCTKSIQPVGNLGPNSLRVFVIKDNDFLSASRMLVILDKKGNVSAYSGGTVSGTGSVALQTMDTVVSAGGVIVGAKAIEHGLENTRIRGIPSNIKVNSTHKIDISGHLDNLH